MTFPDRNPDDDEEAAEGEGGGAFCGGATQRHGAGSATQRHGAGGATARCFTPRSGTTEAPPRLGRGVVGNSGTTTFRGTAEAPPRQARRGAFSLDPNAAAACAAEGALATPSTESPTMPSAAVLPPPSMDASRHHQLLSTGVPDKAKAGGSADDNRTRVHV